MKRSRAMLCLELDARKQAMIEARGRRNGIVTAQREFQEADERLTKFDAYAEAAK